ncbi:hypothetical protein DAEQUDRAFT_689622 [Daedalea quercina L-15889]|uniref:Nuclear rim protein 1 n=1 Tax=Daedalea quercina L-15889 TaxID=1314783 RepID=A0A165QZF5_9APHY|nr:hypothetical protein DAEQUDRAFT_689622 [Daedalea quercina L-15889]
MSSLRRLAQTNNANVAASPRQHASASTQASPTTPVRTPQRTRIVYPVSPVTSPSISASTPFDWEAAKSYKPPPYATPLANRRVRGLRQSDIGTPATGSPGFGTPNTRRRERVIRKKTIVEKITSIPSRIAFEISLFPDNVPRPQPKTSARLLGGMLHFIHFCVRVSRIRKVPDSDLGWEDMYSEGEGEAWFDWTVPASILLFAAAILNTLYFFTRTRLYQLTLATDPVSSPHATFVSRPRTMRTPTDNEAKKPPSRVGPVLWAVLGHLWRGFVVSVRFLLNLSPPKDRQKIISSSDDTERIQQLEVWSPGPLESRLFAIYSPVHALLWTAWTSANWMLIFCVMFTVSMQLNVMTRAYDALIKDKAIIAAEVLHEYDEKFVYPRVNPVRKDAAVMTHESEVVDIWENSPRGRH